MHGRFAPARQEELARSRALAPRLERWFSVAGRDFPWREWRDEYRVLVTEVLLQRTRAGVVATFLTRFLGRYPSWESIETSDRSELEAVLEPLGLQRRRASNLASLASISPTDRRSDRAPGIGQYIGRAVRVNIDGVREAMVDSNFVRVLRRVFPGPWKADYRYDTRLQELAQAVIDGAKDPRAANWAVLDLGAFVCTPRRPRCRECPLADLCPSSSTTQLAGGLA